MEEAPAARRPPLKERLSRLLAEYGPIALVVWLALAALVYVGCYLALKAGMSEEGIASLLEGLGFKLEGSVANLGALGIAYVVMQLTKPIRFIATFALTPVIAKLMGRKRKILEP